MSITLGLGILAGIGAAIGGFSAYESTKNQIDAENENIAFQREQLERQKTYLTDQYNSAVKWTNYQFGQNMAQINQNISKTTQGRDMSAIASADSIYALNKQDEAQLANTVAQYTAQKGSLNQSIASSGFRKTEGTSYEKYTDIVTSEANKAISDAFDAYELNSKQRYLSARMSYIQSGLDIESYRNQLSQVQAQTAYSLESQKKQYDYQITEIDKNSEYLKNQIVPEWQKYLMSGLNAATGAVQTANSFSNLYNTLMSK